MQFLTIWILIISLFILRFPKETYAQSIEPKITPTFHSLGIVWKPGGGSNSKPATVEYKKANDSTWEKAQDLWYDSKLAEYRGSIVELSPNTNYTVRLTIGSTVAQATKSTWSEQFPIARTITLSASSNQQLVINDSDSGTPNGYTLYTGPTGATIDVKNQYPHNILIKGSYIIIRGLTLKNAAKAAIQIGPTNTPHDIVIENNDISGWGELAPDANTDGKTGTSDDFWGERDGAIQADSVTNADPNQRIRRIIIQNNSIHDPRTDSNTTDEYRPYLESLGRKNTYHGHGPQAVHFANAGGNHVIRYNDIYSSSPNHVLDHCIGGEPNQGTGFPYSDSDIYGNSIQNCWSNAIEADGYNINVRIWNNYVNKTSDLVSVAPVGRGPVYIWRNVLNIQEEKPGVHNGTIAKGTTLPGDSGYFGPAYIYHNTILQPKNSQGDLIGANTGVTNSPSNFHLRNNILHVNGPKSLNDPGNSSTNSFNYDLYNANLDVSTTINAEKNGIKGVPMYNPNFNSLGKGYFLDTSSPGFDKGTILPNFNDDFTGLGPDIGAYESGKLSIKFGKRSNNTTTPNPTPVCPADLNKDSSIDAQDLLLVLSGWGSPSGDTTNDGKTDTGDLLLVLSSWGECK